MPQEEQNNQDLAYEAGVVALRPVGSHDGRRTVASRLLLAPLHT
jgi:hypothetical protein